MKAWLLGWLASCVAASAAAAPSGEGDSPPARFAVVVGNNTGDGEGLADLRHADDDAARFFELLSMAGVDVELLSVLDASTQRLHGRAAARARAPTRTELLESLKRIFEKVERAEERGRRTIFYFVYVGHGSVGRDGEGRMHLLDGYLSRSDVFQKILGPSPARINHLIIDACNAYLMVARRGQGKQLDEALSRFLKREDLSAHPDTGVLLSTSKATEVHEWSRFEAGVFSHEVRSALVGAADVDENGKTTYAEVDAFVTAANSRVDHPQARLDVYAAPPALHLDEPLFDRSWVSEATLLEVPASMSGRYWVEDNRGVRYADFHSGPDANVTLVLAPAESYFLRNEAFEIRLPTSMLRSADASRWQRGPRSVRARGSEAESFRKNLFAVPFGPAYYEGFRASFVSEPLGTVAGDGPPAPGTRTRRAIAMVVGGTAVASLVASLVVGSTVDSATQRYRRAAGSESELAALADDVERRVSVTNVLLGTGIGLAVTAATLWFWPARR